MNAGRTARERARAELTREITDAARRQLAEVGAGGLSLRAVSRELGMVSSALYRYFPSRDDLLTALIIESYQSLADAAETAAAVVVEAAVAQGAGGPVDSGGHAGRWQAACAAIRRWARARPHEYALLYGSPVPGYRAPSVTVAPAARIPLLLVGIARAAWVAGELERGEAPASPVLAAQLRDVAGRFAPELPEAVLNRALIAWTQLFGAVSFELFGQLVGSVDPSDEFFAAAVDEMARFVGFRLPGSDRVRQDLPESGSDDGSAD